MGFVKRGRAGGLHFPAGFLGALERHANTGIHKPAVALY
jgi:hypothetical protein